jgi:tRNA pseudouridine55 synthase
MAASIFSVNPELDKLENVKEGQLLLIDKPLHWTSFQVVNKLRYLLLHGFGIKKLKVGHAGTLDPLATGLLVICVGKKTKEIDKYIGQSKTYTGTFTLGGSTPSFDLETSIDQTFETSHITRELLLETAASFLGEQIQIPPVFSAKKIDGKRAYESAREGKKVEMRPNSIEIFQFDILEWEGDSIHFLIKASKGTYIRSIANDFGKKLNSGAYLSSLRRTESGEFSVENAVSIEAFEAGLNKYLEN